MIFRIGLVTTLQLLQHKSKQAKKDNTVITPEYPNHKSKKMGSLSKSYVFVLPSAIRLTGNDEFLIHY